MVNLWTQFQMYSGQKTKQVDLIHFSVFHERKKNADLQHFQNIMTTC